MKHLVGKKVTEKVEFMGDKVEVKKLTVGEILGLQDVISKVNNEEATTETQIKLLQDILRVAVIGADEITDEEFNDFPIEELNKLSEKILSISGLSGGVAEGN